MKINDFIGKVVIDAKTGTRYRLHEITSPSICIISEHPDENGHSKRYTYNTINGNPISNGTLIFEDTTLTESFTVVYDSYCHSKDAYWEDYGYWMRKD
jgi:hypothetical protein